MNSQPIYFDHNSTTPVKKEVLDLIASLYDRALNPSSVHNDGRFAKSIIESARNKIASLLGADILLRKYDVIFTASGTESNNLVMHNYYENADIFISAIEHLSIFEHRKYKDNITLIRVDNNGVLDLGHLEDLLKKSIASKKLLSVMLANNETGVVQDIPEISRIAHKYDAVLHSDVVQAIDKINVNIKDLGADIITISSHKIGGGVGASALIAKAGTIVKPLIVGGGQEKNIRSGTENTIAIACLAKALELSVENRNLYFTKTKILQELLESKLKKYETITIASQKVERLPNTSLIIVPNTDAQEKLIGFDLRNISISSGSACSSGKIGGSHVLEAISGGDDATASIRISFNEDNTSQEVEIFLKAFEEIYGLV